MTRVVDVTAELAGLSRGEARMVSMEGVEVALFQHAGGYSALAGRCPHTGGPLGLGKLAAGEVACPWHGARFDLITGEATRGPAPCGVAVYRLERDGERWLLELPSSYPERSHPAGDDAEADRFLEMSG